MVDASNVSVRGVLQQSINGTWHPISFFSKKLQPAEMKYSTFGRDLLALYLSIRHFRHFLEGHKFYVLTDHKPLTHALSAAPARYSPRETRHLDFISQFTSDIRHINGKENPVADALTRMDINALNYLSAIDFIILAAAQQNDPQIPALKTSSSFCLQDVPLPFSTGTIYVIYQQLCHVPIFHLLTVVIFSLSSIRSRILEFVLHNSSLLKGSFGLVSTKMCANGLVPAQNAKKRKFTAMLLFLLGLF